MCCIIPLRFMCMQGVSYVNSLMFNRSHNGQEFGLMQHANIEHGSGANMPIHPVSVTASKTVLIGRHANS